MSKSLEFAKTGNGVNNGLVRRASDIKDRVFSKRPSKSLPKLSDLPDPSMSGLLHNKHHLKWHKLWCVVQRGCFYGFKTQTHDERAQFAVLLANCAVVYVAEKDKRQKHLYIFKLTQERSKSIYLCTSNFAELMKWLEVLQMESNSIISNIDKIRRPSESESGKRLLLSSSQSSSLMIAITRDTTSGGSSGARENADRSRSKKKKKAPPKPPRHSSCPPPISRDSGTSTAEETLTSGSSDLVHTQSNGYTSEDDLPRYDKAVTHVWQNDRGYLFNVIRAKMTSYGKRKSHDTIYNKDLPGSGNEGLLMVQDSGERKSREVRRARSFNVHSDAMSTEGDVNGTASPTASPTLRKRHKPLVVKRIPTKELVAKQTLAGYVERKGVSMQWMRYWFVLHEGTLFCYLTSTDDVTVDVLNLNGYSVTSLVDKFRGKRFVLQLSHEHFTPLQLSLETREEMEEWEACLGEATKQPSSRVPVGGPDSPTGACADCEGVREDEVDERRKQVKQKLLEEVLRQKYELERKQAERLRKQGRGAPESPDRASTPDMLTDDQRTSDVTRLRQRRMSTQLKVDTLSKQIEKPSSAKRSIFSFGKTKKLDENKNNVFLQDQLKELNEKLHKIDTDLSQVESETKFTDVNQNKKSNYSGNMTSQLMTSERTHDSDEDDGVRSKTLKSAVHKWTAKTFSVKRKQSSTSKHSVNGSLPNLSSTQNGDVDSCGDQESESDNTSEDFLQESVTDLTRPLADLKLNLDLPLTSSQAKNNGSESPSPLGPYNRSGSRTTLSSTLSSPRREIDPSVLAEIDAFEELTKQVLGARSKDVAVAK
ncbi:hypothetical protein DPMN_130433 [Dreissena polymorpha]|uniref:PH domain-containing protein n=2 Tax=Dreissena polymorpha TaxID=45954 RepID=A0A9D4H4N3_DREPO|nr:hypothetical protein DPMN_130433 [Dreissena polymorpha]